MTRINPRRRVAGLLLLLGALVIPGSANAVELGPTNIRPFFGAGYSVPLWFGDFDRGFGFGFGLEMEESPNLSTLFRVEWHFIEGEQAPRYSYGPTAVRRTVSDWSLGARLHRDRQRGLVPYAEGCVGVRLVGGEETLRFATPFGTTAGGSTSSAEAEGVVVTVRLGLSTARPGRSGLTLESGFEFVPRNPDHYAIVPVRLGVVLP